MSAHEDFHKTYITSTEIGKMLGVSRSAVIQGRQKGLLPGAIFIDRTVTLWKREEIAPYVADWLNRRKERLGIA